MTGAAVEERPLVRVERGRPTPEETAALLVVVAARAAEDRPSAARPDRARWERTPAFRPGHSRRPDR
ncbi:acyl-CoA carboxylase subunit epsilon [Streptomyces sp. NPDC102476]|uniref:acyl-CoA carboxylase subunit epsilon n=1 Tax=Streptomyces sp. NPDC102476 TaxID=3366181 RepID=UPI00382FFCA3